METKRWFESKTVWFNIMTFVGGAGLLIADFLGAGTYQPEAIVLLGVGLVNLALRIWFTEQAIG